MSLYSPSERPTNTLNGVGNMSDGSGTINPAALNSNAVLPQSLVDPSPRGTKRSRSPDNYGQYTEGDDNGKRHPLTARQPLSQLLLSEELKPRKRGRPSKTPRTSGDFTGDNVGSLPTPASQTSPELLSTPQLKSQNIPVQAAVTPTQPSPGPKATPKSTLKALPTVRDHTSDTLNAEGDEYIAREYDDAGEQKVDAMGYLQGNRDYKMRTFTLPGRGNRLFMLATECARTLQYRDSYLLFNKNRSLFKIIASPKEKEDLVAKDILPYSYRSRQIAIVTARSMFRQFGSRVIKDGRRVRDDYWEAKARKQGFTEEDAAGEKRPGAARAREAAAAEAMGTRALTAYGDIVYSNGPSFGAVQPPLLHPGGESTMAQLPTIDAFDQSKFKDIQRPRQELTGPPYSDLTRTSGDAEMASQSTHAADYSKNINQQGRYRSGIVGEYWHRPHEPPVSTPQPQVVEPATSQPYTSPRFAGNELPNHQTNVHPQSTAQPAMNPPSFPHQPNPIPSPLRQSSGSQNFRADASQFPNAHPGLPRSSSNLSLSQLHAQQQQQQQPGYGGGAFSPHAMNPPQASWGAPPPQPHPSPGMHRMTTPHQFSPHLAQGQIPSPMPGVGPSHSPHPQQMQPPQMFAQNNAGTMGGQQLYGPGAGLRAMETAGYSGIGIPQQGMYAMGNQGPQFMQQPGQQQAQQNWATSQVQGQPGQGWQGYQ